LIRSHEALTTARHNGMQLQYKSSVDPSDTYFAVMTSRHLDGAMRLSQAEGWSQRREDWNMMMNCSTGIVALSNGDLVGTALRTDFGPVVSTLNSVIVEPNMRGRGIATAMISELMIPKRRYRLVAADEQVALLYQKLGFEPAGLVVKYEGIARGLHQLANSIQRARFSDIAAISKIESSDFDGDRTALVEWLWQNADLRVSRDAEGRINGYAAMRAFGSGYLIGPVSARDSSTASNLIRDCARELVGSFVRIDIANCFHLDTTLTRLGLTRVGTGVPMFCGGSPTFERFALASRALI